MRAAGPERRTVAAAARGGDENGSGGVGVGEGGSRGREAMNG